MGAGASIPDEVTAKQAEELLGPKWESFREEVTQSIAEEAKEGGSVSKEYAVDWAETNLSDYEGDEEDTLGDMADIPAPVAKPRDRRKSVSAKSVTSSTLSTMKAKEAKVVAKTDEQREMLKKHLLYSTVK